MENNKPYTKHALKRGQQRGVTEEMIRMIITFADREIPIGRGCIALSVSRARLTGLVGEGRLPAQYAEKIAKLALVQSNDNAIVTVLRPKDGSGGRHYGKGVKRGYRQRDNSRRRDH